MGANGTRGGAGTGRRRASLPPRRLGAGAGDVESCGDPRLPRALQDASRHPRVPLRRPGRERLTRGSGRGAEPERSLAMGHNGSWVPRNASEPRNASGAEAAGANRSALGELGEAQLYRHFTTTVQVVIFIGSLLGKPPARPRGPPAGSAPRARAPAGPPYGGAQVAGGGLRVSGELRGTSAGTVHAGPPLEAEEFPRRAFSRPRTCPVQAAVSLPRPPSRGGRRVVRAHHPLLFEVPGGALVYK